MADRINPPKGWLIASLIFLILSMGGCATGGVGLVSFGSKISDSVQNSTATAYGQTSSLEATGSKVLILTTTSDVQCQVRDAQTRGTVPLDDAPDNFSGSIDSNGRSYRLRYVFDSNKGQRFQAVCSGADAGAYALIPFPSGVLGLLPSLAGIGLGILFFVLAVIFLIVGLIVRSRWKKRNAAGGAPMGPGGYVPPPPPPGYGTPQPAPGYGPPPSQLPPGLRHSRTSGPGTSGLPAPASAAGPGGPRPRRPASSGIRSTTGAGSA